MLRLVSKRSAAFALTLMATPAFAGPAPAPAPAPAPVTPAPVGASDQFILDCQVNGRTQRYSIVNGMLTSGSGAVTQLDEDVYSVTTAEGNFLLTYNSVQISGGRDAGKWDCVLQPAQAGNVVAGVPAIDPAEFAALQQSVDTLRDQLARSEADLRAANTERDTAQAGVAQLQGQLNDTLASAAAAQAAQAEAEAGLTRSEMSLAAAMADNVRLEAELGMATSAFAALDVELAVVEAATTALERELSTAQATIGRLERELSVAQQIREGLELALAGAREMMGLEEMSDGDAMADETSSADPDTDAMAEVEVVENQPTMMADGFDADVAMGLLDGADLSPISHAALAAAIDQARANPDMVAEVMSRLQAVLGE